MYDLIIIGGGPGGYLAAERAGQAGLSTVVFEKANMGGVCLNEGCIPSKALLNSAKLFGYANGEALQYGVSDSNPGFNAKNVVMRKNQVVAALCGGVEMTVKASGVTIVKEVATITGKSAEGFTVEAAGQTYEAKQLIIASGAEVFIPPIPGAAEGLASGYCITSREALNVVDPIAELVIIGGGVIGLEFASYFNSIGTKVTVVEMMDKIGGPLDAEIAAQLQKLYELRGVKFYLSSQVNAIGAEGVTFTKDGAAQTVPASKVLIAAGRKANTNIGLDSIGVETDRRGIVTDSHMRTNVPGVYAIGDCTGKTMLAHVAYRAAEVAVNNICGKDDSMDGNCIPSVIYAHPEVASAGLTEAEAKAAGKNIRVIKVPAAYSGRAMAESNESFKMGMCKLIVDKDANTVIGAHLFCPYASEMILSCVMMIDLKLPLDRIRQFIFPHPTVGELIREALFK